MASSAVETGCGCEARKKEKFQTVCHWLCWFKPSGVKTHKGKRFTLSCLMARPTNLLSLASRRCECMRRLPEARLSRGRNYDCHIRCGRALQPFSIDSRDMIGIGVTGFDTSVGIVCRHDRFRIQFGVWPVWRCCPVHIVTYHRSCTCGPG